MKPAEARARISLKNVLFATDLSHVAEAAIPYVREITRLYGSNVHMVHVRPRAGAWDATQQKELERFKERLEGIPNEVSVEDGDTRQTLLRLAKDKAADLLVVGTHGRSGLGRVLIGSVAEAVFREAPCPVMTVGPRLATDPKWNLKIKEILYATDLEPTSMAAAAYAISLAQENQAKLTILNVQSEPKVGELVESERFISSTVRRLQEIVPVEANLWCEPHCMVEVGDPAEKILDVAGRHQSDLIVLGIRPHSVAMATHISRPTAHRVVAGASCPVLTVRG